MPRIRDKETEAKNKAASLKPEQIAKLERDIPEKVMGWKWDATIRWSPWDNAADALGVLYQLQSSLQDADGNQPDIHLRQTWSDHGPNWSVAIGSIMSVKDASGSNKIGPPICLLAAKIMEISIWR